MTAINSSQTITQRVLQRVLRLDLSTYSRRSALAIGGSLLANLFIYLIASLIGAFHDDFLVATPVGATTMNVGLIIQSTLMYLVMALLGLYIARKVIKVNVRVWQVFAVLFVLGTFTPLAFLEGELLSKGLLGSMHLVTAIITIPLVLKE